MRRPPELLSCLLTAALLMGPAPARADEFNWTGSGGANWNDAANWTNTSGGVATVPDGDDNVTFAVDATVSGGAALGLTNSATLSAAVGTIALGGGPVVNTGEITFQGSGSTGDEVYSLAADVALSGAGTLRLVEQNDSRIVGPGVLTNGVGHTLRGRGRVETAFVNQGAVIAEGGVLHFSGGSFDNTAGAITVAADGVLTAPGVLVDGGALHGEAGGRLGSGATLRGVDLTGEVTQALGTTFLEGVIGNAGKLTFEASGSTADEVLSLVGDVTLSGAGTLELKQISDSRVVGTGTLILAGGQTLRGSGTVEVDIDNSDGVVIVDPGAKLVVSNKTITGGTVDFDATGVLVGGAKLADLAVTGVAVREPGVTRLQGTITNTGEITYQGSGSTGDEVYRLDTDVSLLGNGTLRLLENSDSVISGLSGSEVLTNGPMHTLRGAGTVSTDVVNQNKIIAEAGVLTLSGGAVDNTAGVIEVSADGRLTAAGSVITGGSILFTPGAQLGDGGTLADVATSGTVEQQFGTTNLSGLIANTGELGFLVSGSTANSVYRLTADVTLNGAGTLRLRERNDHLVTGAVGTEVLTNGADHVIRGAGQIAVPIVNMGLVVAEAGELLVTSATIDNTVGEIEVAADGQLTAAAVIDGGILRSAPGGLMGNGATLRNVTLRGRLAQNFGATTLEGTLQNEGTLTFISSGSTANAIVQIDTPVTITGPGEIVLTEINDTALAGAGSLANTGGHTIRGTGEIAVDVDNAGGLIQIDPGATLRVNTTLSGGELNFDPTGRLIGTPTLRDLTSSGTHVRSLGVTLLGGQIENNGLMTFQVSGSTADAVFRLADDLTLSGSGVLEMREYPDNVVDGAAGTEVLTNGAGHRVAGTGRILVDVVNEGAVRPGARLDQTGDFTQAAGGELIASNVAYTDWGELNVSQTAALDGGLVVDYVGLIPVGEHTFDLLKADSITGDFSGLTILDAEPWVGTASYEILIDEIGATDVLRVTVENSSSGVPGDFNNDGLVDAADYTVWRDLQGQAYTLPNDDTPGVIDQSDYETWRDHYGDMFVGLGLPTSPAPEPAGTALIAAAALAISNRHRRATL